MNAPEYYERNLPHRMARGSTLFLTFRLAGSLPAAAVARLRTKRAAGLAAGFVFYAEQRRYFGQFDALLDAASSGPTWLRLPAVAALVSEALHHRHGSHYELVAYCLMPNHVHVVLTLPDEAPPLIRTLQSLKAHTALRANQLLHRTGPFWQRETYDHIVRGAEEGRRIVAYVLNNPVKAGWVDNWEQWPHTYWNPDHQ